MPRLEITEYCVLAIIIAVPLALLTIRTLLSGLRDDQKPLAGAVAVLAAIGLIIYGVSRVTSAESQVMSRLGQLDLGAVMSFGFGAFLGIVGLRSLSLRQPSSRVTGMPTSKKCPFCAESIKVDAKLCRFCGSALDAGSNSNESLKAHNHPYRTQAVPVLRECRGSNIRSRRDSSRQF